MKVICKRATTKLVKGATYDVFRLNNKDPKRSSITVGLGDKVLGSFVTSGFTKEDGSKLDEIEWTTDRYKKQIVTNEYISDVRTLKRGDIIVCKWKGGNKFLDSGSRYKVSEILYREIQGNYGVRKEQKIKLEGHNRWIDPYRFRPLNSQEKRELSLGEIFGEKAELEVVDVVSIKKMRVIDRWDEKTKVKAIVGALIESVTDPSKNNLSTIDWAIEKRGKKFDLSLDDIKPLLNKKLSDILKMCE